MKSYFCCSKRMRSSHCRRCSQWEQSQYLLNSSFNKNILIAKKVSQFFYMEVEIINVSVNTCYSCKNNNVFILHEQLFWFL